MQLFPSDYEPYWSNYLNQFDLPSSYFQNIPDTTTKYCVIVEPREHPYLINVIKNFMFLLRNKGYGLIIFHGTTNESFIKTALDGWPNVKYHNLNKPNLTIVEYNNLYKSISFWDILLMHNCEHALTFETDSVLLKDSIDDYLEYDYIGAPWKDVHPAMNVLTIGNSGFCLRKPVIMKEIITKYGNTSICQNNDGYFAVHLKIYRYNIPSFEVANTFSVETAYHSDPCGMHKPWLNRFPAGEFERIMSKRFNIHSYK